MSKRKILLAALSLCMIAILAVGSSLAYLTDFEEAENVFTVGKINVTLLEQERKLDDEGKYTDELQNFTQEQNVHPGVYEVKDENGKIIPTTKMPVDVNGVELKIRDNVGNYVDKIISAKNESDSEKAYLRIIIAKPIGQSDLNTWEENGLVQLPDTGKYDTSNTWLHTNISSAEDAAGNYWYWDKTGKDDYPSENPENFYTVDQVKIGEVWYELTVATHVEVVDPDNYTAACYAGFYLDNDVNYDPVKGEWYIAHDSFATIEGIKEVDGEYRQYLGDISNVQILVALQGVQADGFDDAYTAFRNSFGDITATNHPWVD